MADEANETLIPEAPSTEAAAPTPEAPAEPNPYEKRYADLRSEFDRRNSLLDKARNGDIDAIRELGFDVDEPDPTPTEEYEDPYAEKFSQTQKELEELKAWKAEREAEALYNNLNSHVDELAKATDFKLSKQDRNYILSQAVEGGEVSREKTEAAFKAHVEYVNSIRDSVKPNPDRPGAGQPAIKDFDPATASQQELHEYLVARMTAPPAS